MDDGGVAGVEPAVANGARRGLGIVVVALHHDVAAHDDLAERLAIVRDLVAVVVYDLQLAGGDQLDALARLDRRAFVRRQLACSGRGSQTVMNGDVSVSP